MKRISKSGSKNSARLTGIQGKYNKLMTIQQRERIKSKIDHLNTATTTFLNSWRGTGKLVWSSLKAQSWRNHKSFQISFSGRHTGSNELTMIKIEADVNEILKRTKDLTYWNFCWTSRTIPLRSFIQKCKKLEDLGYQSSQKYLKRISEPGESIFMKKYWRSDTLNPQVLNNFNS